MGVDMSPFLKDKVPQASYLPGPDPEIMHGIAFAANGAFWGMLIGLVVAWGSSDPGVVMASFALFGGIIGYQAGKPSGTSEYQNRELHFDALPEVDAYSQRTEGGPQSKPVPRMTLLRMDF